MNNKQIGIGIICIGVAAMVSKVFIPFKFISYIGYFLLFVGAVVMIAGDKLPMFKVKDKFKDMTPEQIIALKRQEFELKKLDKELQIEQLKLDAQIAALKPKQQDNKMPDLLGNLAPMYQNGNKIGDMSDYMIKPKK